MPTDFTYDNGAVPATKSDLTPAPSTSLDEYLSASDVNIISGALSSLRTGVLAGQYHGLTDNPSAPLSGAGVMLLRSNSGTLQASYNGGAYANVAATVSMAAFGSSPNANGGTFTSGVLTLQPADATRPGLVSAAAQTFGGAKTAPSWTASTSGGGTFYSQDTGASTNAGWFSLQQNAGQSYIALQAISDAGALQTTGLAVYRSGRVFIGQTDASTPSLDTSASLTVGGPITMGKTLKATGGYNNFTIDGAASTGNPVTLTASGSDLSVDITMVPKGSGVLKAPALTLTTTPLAIGSGGTGGATQQAALNAVAGAVTSGSYLRGNGTNVSMSAIQAGDVPTLNQNTSGSAASLSATLAIGSGGTGQTTAQAAVDALLPAQGSASGKFLTSNGTTSSWGTVSAGVTTMAAVGSSPSANGASISGSTLTLQPADGTHPGVISTAAQTITGAKTFDTDLTVSPARFAINPGRTPAAWPFEVWTSSTKTTQTDGAAKTTMLVMNNDTVFGSHPEAGISFFGLVNGSNGWVSYGAISAFKESTTSGEYAGSLRFCTSGAGSPGAGEIEAMRINSSQRVLVGVTTDDATSALLQLAGKISLAGSYTNNAGSPGATTINKASGRAAIASTASSVVVTNSLVSTTSIVLIQLESTGVGIDSLAVSCASGSFTVSALSGLGVLTAVTGTTQFSFVVLS